MRSSGTLTVHYRLTPDHLPIIIEGSAESVATLLATLGRPARNAHSAASGVGTRHVVDSDVAPFEPLFKFGSDDLIHLRMLPRTPSPETDGILLLLWAYRAFAGQEIVKATLLRKGANESGLSKVHDRVSKYLDPHGDLVVQVGDPHYSRYSLTVAGVDFARTLGAQMLAYE